jgi:signal transduction histidine kinase
MGLGLRSMRERAEKLRGKLQIESAVGKGTCVSLSLSPPDNS